MLQDQLLKLLKYLDDLQQVSADNIVSAMHMSETDTLPERDQLGKELETVINLDRSCRHSLAPMEEIIENIEVSHTSYLTFIHTASKVLALVGSCSIHVEASATYTTVEKLIQSQRQFSLQEIFTIISLIIMIVALCMRQLDTETQKDTIQKLDQLLNIKLQQLKLLNELVSGENSAGWIS